MRATPAFLALGLLAAAPAAGQGNAAPAPERPANPYSGLFIPWGGANREAMDAQARAPAQQPLEQDGNAVPAYSPLAPRSQAEAVALGERVGTLVRNGDCAGGERVAREAGDLALVRAVREHCARAR